PRKEVRVYLRVNEREALVHVEDQGQGFNPNDVADPLAPENLERPSGRGVYLMRCYLTWLRYNERGNAVTLCRSRSEAISAWSFSRDATAERGPALRCGVAAKLFARNNPLAPAHPRPQHFRNAHA